MAKSRNYTRAERANIGAGKMLRIFQTIMLLAQGRHTVHSLSMMLNTNERTVYRYFNVLEEIGFAIENDFATPTRYFLNREAAPVWVKVFTPTTNKHGKA